MPELGDIVRLSVVFTVGGNPTDPTDVSLTVRDPDGTITTQQYNPGNINRDGVGLFHYDQDASKPGLWAYKYVGTGTAADVGQSTFYVRLDVTADSPYLCTIEDVQRYVPSYIPNDKTDATLQDLIAATSTLIPQQSGREIIGVEPTQPAVRTFDINETAARTRTVHIGDLASSEDLALRLLRQDGVVIRTVDPASVVPLYDGERQPSQSWEPITALLFPYGMTGAAILYGPDAWFGQVLEVTGRWGFPEIPAFIREATAARVILRYISEVDAHGTGFAQAIRDSGLNLGGLFQSSQDALAVLGGGLVIA